MRYELDERVVWTYVDGSVRRGTVVSVPAVVTIAWDDGGVEDVNIHNQNLTWDF